MQDVSGLDIRAILVMAAEELESISETAMLDAQLLLAKSLGCTRTVLMARDYKEPIDRKVLTVFKGLMKLRTSGYPIAYILGYKEFYGRLFFVDERVLIPRADTEILVETVLKYVEKNEVQTIREVGFGSGAISLTLACELENKAIIASDVSAEAYEVFQKNREYLSGQLKSDVTVFVGNLWDDQKETDVLVANLPYLTADECIERREQRWQEPMLALNGEVQSGDRGLGLIYTLIQRAKGRVQAIFLEASSEQMHYLAQALHQAEFRYIKIEQDLAGQDRVIWAISERYI
ncbi:peptide chain release factor N(5)-glutamine methyltransferase [Entomospira entomophila]|uniref:peptide chain release factor N(5)-glutamine methyltransferase n=1 Tax=Entomospira entomophila TaxID=2719988 RepID=A0A968GBX3_9SPIO|nr:HemK/PrmC family methyltransferase [Entomospira entomophilus]NIZ40793.1 peptide chain release factor N(5)-glutamine methyltransferase [Entomospira entomophilus]WDI35006.1 peptide chain release factor N(5)-glutamine methyltransferase [Entomospira entomophilus]